MVTVAVVQGAYYLLTGAWSLLHVESFMALTGPKTDVWLVKTVGVLVSVIGLALLLAGIGGQVEPGLIFIAIGTALGLLAIEVAYTLQRVIPAIYLADAVLEGGFVLWWVALR